MEIQNRDILLQQILNTKTNSLLPFENKEFDFAKILKETDWSKEQIVEKFSDSKEKNQVKVSAKETSDRQVAEEKNVEKKPEKEVKEKDSAKPAQKEKQKIKEKDDEVQQMPVQNSQTVETQKNKTSEDLAAEVSVAVEEVSVENGVNEEGLLSNIEEGLNFVSLMTVGKEEEVLVQKAVEEVTVSQENIENNVVEEVNTPVKSENNGEWEPVKNISKNEAVVFENEKTDEKLIRPSEDVKVSFDDNVKVQISVEEEKIAAPIEKDVVKNSFEIKSMFQSVDADNETLYDEVSVQNSETDNGMTNQTSVTINNDLVLNKNVVAQENGNAVNATIETKGLTDAVEITVSGKETVFNLYNVAKNEAFTRINEVSSRNEFQGMEKEVVEQVKVNITKSAVKGVDTIDIQLKPEDLGKIQIKMHIAKDGKLQAEIISSRVETMDLLQREVSSLAKTFNDAGYDTDSKSFNFSFQGESFAEQRENNSERLQFIGKALEQEAEELNMNDNLIYDPALGLNIRV
ncbi:MAG: flagellar hook-length control protein FliK [Alphaproteobacteria bacterium]|nr:flagellar hook-length control protein FliK [Alphaproteobacteria bacterium]